MSTSVGSVGQAREHSAASAQESVSHDHDHVNNIYNNFPGINRTRRIVRCVLCEPTSSSSPNVNIARSTRESSRSSNVDISAHSDSDSTPRARTSDHEVGSGYVHVSVGWVIESLVLQTCVSEHLYLAE